jgi:hypothetical protein
MVQNGELAAVAAAVSVSALNRVDWPPWGSPTMPHLNPWVLQSIAFIVIARLDRAIQDQPAREQCQ